MLPRYRDWAPTAMDSRGLNLPDRQEWFVAPVVQTRDSGPLDESNFAAFVRGLTDAGCVEGESFEIHRFGHWGPGWFEIVLINPDVEGAIMRADAMADALAAYPVLDEADLSERECEAQSQEFDDYIRRDIERAIERDCDVWDADDVVKALFPLRGRYGLIYDLHDAYRAAIDKLHGGEWEYSQRAIDAIVAALAPRWQTFKRRALHTAHRNRRRAARLKRLSR